MFFGFGYNSFDVLFSFMFLIVASVIVVAVVKSMAQHHRDNNSPRLKVEAVVVDKREEIRHEQQPVAGDVTGAHGYHTIISSSYWVTFQVESGDKMDFLVDGNEYKRINEGEKGKLLFQGSRYLGFESGICEDD